MHTLTNAQITFLDPQGSIDKSTVETFEKLASDVLASGHCSVLVVDMHTVESIDSYGLMALISTLNAAQHMNCSFKLCKVSPAVQIILEVSQLDQVFEILEDRPAIAPLAA